MHISHFFEVEHLYVFRLDHIYELSSGSFIEYSLLDIWWNGCTLINCLHKLIFMHFTSFSSLFIVYVYLSTNTFFLDNISAAFHVFTRL